MAKHIRWGKTLSTPFLKKSENRSTGDDESIPDAL